MQDGSGENIENSKSIGYETFFHERLGKALEEKLLPEKVKENIYNVKREVREFLLKGGILQLNGSSRAEVMVDPKYVEFVTDYINSKIEGVLKDHIIEAERGEIHKLKGDLHRTNEEVSVLNEKLDMAMHDELTGLDNRRHIADRFDGMIENLRRNSRKHEQCQKVAVILLDIDKFKLVNDTYGHDAGDAVLKKIALLMKKRMFRKSDIAGRWGGEELLCILPDCDLDEAVKKAELIREDIENEDVEVLINNKLTTINVTATFGVSMKNLEIGFEDEPEVLLKEELVKAADKLLYIGKENGRNVVNAITYADYVKQYYNS